MKNQIRNSNRRTFIKQSLVAGAGTIITASALESCSSNEEEVSPAEDLMREHGVLNRILFVYDHCQNLLTYGDDFPLSAIADSATIIRTFIEDYHEKLEEDFLFPRFEKAKQLTELITVLRQQHKAGRGITDQISALAKSKSFAVDESKKMIVLLSSFNYMYRPHEAREDTVLFPALRKIVTRNEYDALGEDFEDKEHELFGSDGFESMVNKVVEIEKQLGIYELSKFTPKLT